MDSEAAKEREKASELEARAAQDEKDEAALKKIAADEQLARLKLEAEIQPRTLSLQQQKQLADATKGFVGHGVELFSYTGDADGARLGGMIKAGLLKGKIIVSDRRNGMMMVNSSEPEGVQITDNDHALAVAISNALTAAHIANKIVPRVGAENVRYPTIYVGAKPFDVLK